MVEIVYECEAVFCNFGQFRLRDGLNYIDRLKGLAILLIVMGHVYGMALDLTGNVAYRVISSFHMSLFMFLSGLVGLLLPCSRWI